jgi:hypothetical protein
VVKGTGDDLLAAFGGVVDALGAAIAIQQACIYPIRPRRPTAPYLDLTTFVPPVRRG